MSCDVEIITDVEIENKINSLSLYSPKKIIKFKNDPKLNHDIFQLCQFFTRIHFYEFVFIELNRRFNNFLGWVYPELRIVPDYNVIDLSTWYYNKILRLPNALPRPIDSSIAWAKQQKTNDVLLMFLVAQFQSMGVFKTMTNVDDVMLYATDFVEGDALVCELKRGKFYVEQTPTLLLHSKYAHMLQIVLLDIVLYAGKIILKTKMTIKDIIPMLVTKNSSGKMPWSDVLEIHQIFTFAGPIGLNTLCLSPFMKQHAPLFHHYWALAYCKKLGKFDSPRVQDELEQLLLGSSQAFYKKYERQLTFKLQEWKVKYQAQKVPNANNLYIKTKRSSIFLQKQELMKRYAVELYQRRKK